MNINYKDDYEIIKKDEIDLKILWKVLNRNKKSIFIIYGILLIPVIIYLFFIATPLYYSNSTLFKVQNTTKSPINNLSSIASIAGLNMGSSSSSTNVNLVDYVSSRTLKFEILNRDWNTKKKKTNLITHWGINDTTKLQYHLKMFLKSITRSAKKTDEEKSIKWTKMAMNKLDKRIDAKYKDTGLLTVEVLMEDPLLAQSIADYIVRSIINYTSLVNMDSWKRTREFYIQRLEEIKVELDIAENTFTNFQKENRRVIDSPDLIARLANLKRDLEIKTTLFLTLQNEYEIARIEETKDLTEFKILDKASYPMGISKPNKKLSLIVFLIVGFIISIPTFLIVRTLKYE